MTTATEMAGVIEWIKDRWPNSSIHRNWERVVRDFAYIPVTAVHEAASNHYQAGNRNPPSFSELRSEAARIAAEKGLADPNQNGCDIRGSHSRNFAILDHPDKPGLRIAECLDCGTEWIREAHKLLTVGEAQEVAKHGRPGPDDDLAERIAP